MDYCVGCQRSLNGAVCCQGCGTQYVDIEPGVLRGPSPSPEARGLGPPGRATGQLASVPGTSAPVSGRVRRKHAPPRGGSLKYRVVCSAFIGVGILLGGLQLTDRYPPSRQGSGRGGEINLREPVMTPELTPTRTEPTRGATSSPPAVAPKSDTVAVAASETGEQRKRVRESQPPERTRSLVDRTPAPGERPSGAAPPSLAPSTTPSGRSKPGSCTASAWSSTTVNARGKVSVSVSHKTSVSVGCDRR